MLDKETIIDEIKRVVRLLGREDISRDEFLSNTQIISRKDLENIFRGWAYAFEAAGFKPNRHYSISDEELFNEYTNLLKKLGHYPLGSLGIKEINNNSIYSGSTFKKRFKGLKNFAIEYQKWAKNKNREIFKKSLKLNTVQQSEKISEEGVVSVRNTSRYYNGKAAEFLVIAELLFRGYNAQIMPVDEGLDVFAVKEKSLYLIQIKHSSYDTPSISRQIQITLSSLDRNKGLNVFYILVLSRKEPSQRDFLILPYSKIDELIRNGMIKKIVDAKKISFKVVHTTPENAFIEKMGAANDVSRYLNAWDILL
ncbi:MAG: hypothetical protein WA103_01560 [Minisyncoccales bacterium]